MIYRITSLQNEQIKRWAELKQNQARRERNEFMIEGPHLLGMALAAGIVKAVIAVAERDEVPEAIDQYVVPDHVLAKLSAQVTPQGVVAVCSFFPEKTLEGRYLCYLDGVNDPGNVGTIIRTAAAFGIDGIMLGPQSASLYHPKVVSASQGAIFTLDVAFGDISWLAKMKKEGYVVVGTLIDDKATQLAEYVWPDKAVVVFGSEAHGISPEAGALLDAKLTIPMDKMESLNVGVAAGIVFYQLKKR